MVTRKLFIKVIGILILCIFAIAAIGQAKSVLATDATTPLYVGIKRTDPDATWGYAINNPLNGSGANSAWIWNLISYKSAAATEYYNTKLYCLKANTGTWNTSSASSIVTYNRKYNMDTEVSTILSENPSNTIVSGLTNGAYYKQILWTLSNVYVPGVSSSAERANLLTSAGINESNYSNFLNDADIEAVQQAVIWYFTNKGDSTFDKLNLTNWLYYTPDGGSSYSAVADYAKFTTGEGPERNEQAELLYNYLINAANTNAPTYSTETKPVNVDVTGLPVIDEANKKYQTSSSIVGNNFVVGPIKINKNNNSAYEINFNVTDENSTAISDYTFCDASGNSLGAGKTIKDLVGTTFYISVPAEKANTVNVSIDTKYNVTNKTMWLSSTSNVEQPLVEIQKQENNEKVTLTVTPQLSGEYKLKLVKINSVDNEITVPGAKFLVTLPDGTTKNVVSGADGTITIEGIKISSLTNQTITIQETEAPAGYVAGIGTIQVNVTVKKSGAKYVINQATLSGSTVTNLTLVNDLITVTIPNTPANGTFDLKIVKFDSEDNSIKLAGAEFKVTLSDGTTRTATSAADGTITITGIGISSTTQQILKIEETKAPTGYTSGIGVLTLTVDVALSGSVYAPTKVTMTGSTSAKVSLSNGVISLEVPNKKVVVFDLALKKFITAVSSDENIDTSDYLKDSTGTYTRASKVTGIQSGKVIYDDNAKNPVLVNTGDYVLYTIRVYNEGQTDGYASLIKDSIPEGLQFVATNTTYNAIWDLSQDLTSVSTDYLARGKGAELDAVAGEANYQANLLKALDSTAAVSNTNPNYRDVQVLFKVTEPPTSNRVLTNYAQIADDSDADGNPVDDIDSIPNQWNEGEDDQDIERVKLQYFDLALRKSIVTVSRGEETQNYANRLPTIDITKLKSGEATTATYNHDKKPVNVQVGDVVKYRISIYNEGNVDGNASEITDYLPSYLEFIKDSTINTKYGWTISADGRIAKSNYLSTAEHSISSFNGTTLDSDYIEIECKVKSGATTSIKQTNIAEITEYKYKNEIISKDVDSTSKNITLPKDEELPTYRDTEIQSGVQYIPGQEDDDDFEKVYVQIFDLSLRKMITQIGDKAIETRMPKVTFADGKFNYEQNKDPLEVIAGNTVIYTIRVYNEGEIDGYASLVTDDIPQYLTFITDSALNKEYKWLMYDKDGNATEDVKNAVKVKSDYLSKANESEDKSNLIKAFDGTTLSYKELQIAFKVSDPGSSTYVITNHAQISDDSNSDGNPVDDVDSKTDEWNEGEDDQDVENVVVKYFDLALLKYVSKVIVVEDGARSETETGYNGTEQPDPVVKVEINRKKINKTSVKFVYSIKVTNEGDIAGYAKEVTDYVPQGLKFVAEDNTDWVDEGNNVISTKALQNTLLQPGESAVVQVTLTWINGSNNLGIKTNVAEISMDDNDKDAPDIDSTPDNKADGEDDIDDAKVVLSISTGEARIYYSLTFMILAVLGTGIVLIKKFVI